MTESLKKQQAWLFGNLDWMYVTKATQTEASPFIAGYMAASALVRKDIHAHFSLE